MLKRMLGPVQKLRRLLIGLSQTFEGSADLTTQAIELVGRLSYIIQNTHGRIDQMRPSIHETASRLNGAAELIKDVGDGFSGVSVPLFRPSTTPATLSLPIPTDIDPGPPPTLIKENLSLNMPWFDRTDTYPLTPLGQVLAHSGEEMGKARLKLEDVALHVEQVRNYIEEANNETANLIKQVLKPLLRLCNDAAQLFLNISSSKLFDLLPLLLSGFFVALHAAIALVGFALLTLWELLQGNYSQRFPSDSVEPEEVSTDYVLLMRDGAPNTSFNPSAVKLGFMREIWFISAARRAALIRALDCFLWW
jgi:hypothetical protein